ncbi:unnamed protein product [Fraxinus pennsylvanica]|uniref:Uncharacterized protein n=1 Tax=Fraxinus pennsylvanica TaxID=56036 RepID=A0AAD2A0C3_9LAMI|nr:unnamed protein product [Fraxinus pennsylvanica]
MLSHKSPHFCIADYRLHMETSLCPYSVFDLCLLSQEEILVEVSQTFGCKLFADKAKNLECFHALELTVPKILSQDLCSRFQLFDGFPKLREKAEAKIAKARANMQLEPLICPSVQWYDVTWFFRLKSGEKKDPIKLSGILMVFSMYVTQYPRPEKKVGSATSWTQMGRVNNT